MRNFRYGSAGASKRVDPDSVFRIASISKPITAFVVLHLCLDYNVGLDSKVFGKKGILKTYKYRDQRVTSITIRHLLQHSAGWDRDVAGDLAFVRPAAVTRCDPESAEHNHALLSCVLKKRLQFKPGSRHAYSNLGYLVLGLVIEAITGMAYAAYLSQVLAKWSVAGIGVGGPWRADWASTEVEYFNNRDPLLVSSLHKDLGELLPQYGGLAMSSAAAYGGLVANATSLLQFMNVIEGLASASTCTTCVDQFTDGGDSVRDVDAVTAGIISVLVKESLTRPDYESVSGMDWYGLGWDVQDNGRSWGHTGGMEGTSCILFHHHTSGLSWVLLLNAWAKDIDLNGVMKCALSRVPRLPRLFDCDVKFVREMMDDDGSMEREEFVGVGNDDCCGGRVLFSKGKSQVIVLGVDEMTAYKVTSLLKVKGYTPTWINVFRNELEFSLTGGLNYKKPKFSKMSIAKNQKSSFSLSNFKYVLIFSNQSQQYEDFIVVLNKGKDEILSLTKEKEVTRYVTNFIDSFSDSSGNIRFCAVMIKYKPDDVTNSRCERCLHLAMKANVYVRQVKLWAKSQSIVCQSVSEIKGELFVTALLENKRIDSNASVDFPSSSYWVQIEPESFVTELNRKIKQGMSLTYAKFFNADEQSWVSGCWTSGRLGAVVDVYHRVSMSKYGLLPELAEAAAENIPLLSVSEYEDEGVVYYAGLWLAN